MHQYPEIPDRPDLKMGGNGDSAWIEIDFYWEREGVCLLLDQPERHSPYTRRIDLARDTLLRSFGLDVERVGAREMDERGAFVSSALQARLHDRRAANRRVFSPDLPWTSTLSRHEPLVNVTRTIAWLRGDPDAKALVPEWPCHYDRERLTWDYDPGGADDLGLMPVGYFTATHASR
ncbi:MAG: hypothetical protein JWL76_2105 [Thermoleophilia bacterium]|nr:hypothetical protein [Thermoleophilia bacterium]